MIDQSNFSFPAIVAGNTLTATVLSVESEDRDFYYRVLFSDHFEDVFHVIDGRLVGLRSAEAEPYAEAIRYDVGQYVGFDPEKFWKVFQEEVDGEMVNVWVFEQEEEDEEENIYSTFNVHVKGKFRFHMVNVGDGWMASTKNETPLTESDRMLAEKVEDLLIALI